jgi:SAM-dependent methyltransferase
MRLDIKTRLESWLSFYPRWKARREFTKQRFKRFNERPVEFAFVFRHLSRIYPRTILDVGSGQSALPHLMQKSGFVVTAVDNVRDYWRKGMFNRHFHVLHDDITKSSLTGPFDLITCISVLEHIEASAAAMRNMFRLLPPGGHLILTCPYSERSYVRNVYELPGSSYGKGRAYITQSYSRAELDLWLREGNGSVVEQEFWQFWEGEHWTVGRQVIPPRPVSADDRHQLTCLLLRKGGE